MAKKPWRVVQVGDDAGRFTREQIEAAVQAVKDRKEAKGRKGRSGPFNHGPSVPRDGEVHPRDVASNGQP